MDDEVPAAAKQEAGLPPVSRVAPRRPDALLVHELDVFRREGRCDDFGESDDVRGHFGKGAGERDVNPGAEQLHPLGHAPPGTFGRAQFSIELLGALQVLSGGPLLAGLDRAYRPCVLGGQVPRSSRPPYAPLLPGSPWPCPKRTQPARGGPQ